MKARMMMVLGLCSLSGLALGKGMILPTPSRTAVKASAWTEQVSIEFGLGRGDGSFAGGGPMDLAATIENKGARAIAGTFACAVETDDRKSVARFSEPLDLGPGRKARESFEFNPAGPGVYKVTFSINLADGPGVLAKSMNLVYAPEKMGRLTRQPDFAEFWKKTKKELAAVDPQFKMTKMDYPTVKTQDVYLVEMRSLGNVRVRGWYSVPKKPGRYPVILEQPGAGGEMQPQLWDGMDDFIFFSLNPRGHGNSQDDFKPSKVGFWYTGLESRETFAFRGAYMDAVRAVDFLMTRPEVDRKRVVAEGISQGGGLSLAVAALDSRVKYCVADVPGMADWESYETVRLDPTHGGWARWTDAHPGSTKEELLTLMSYSDVMNLTPWIKADTWVVSGLQDPRVPPRGVYEAYSNIKGKKKITIFPHGTHDAGGGAQWFDKYRTLRKKFHMPANPAFESVAQAKGK